MAETEWVSLGLFHPSKWSYFILLISDDFGPTEATNFGGSRVPAVKVHGPVFSLQVVACV